MLMSSIWVGLAMLATLLMVADWYIWEPRHRISGSGGPEPDLAAGVDKGQINLRNAA